MESLTALTLMAFLIALYLLPALVAQGRGHHQRCAIWVLNLLLGWTLLGWVGALVWSATRVESDHLR